MNRDEILKTNKHYWDTYADLWFGTTALPTYGKALTAAQPKDLDASEIEVRLGATWIDKEYIQQFMYETFNTRCV